MHFNSEKYLINTALMPTYIAYSIKQFFPLLPASSNTF